MAQEQKPGSIVHVEIRSREPAKTKEFYGRVFGWKFQDIPEMKYTLWEAPSPPHGGLQMPDTLPPGVLTYLLSDDVEETSRRIQAAGGTILVPKKEIPGQGWFAVFQDPDGTVQALFESPPKPRPTPKRRKATRTRASRRARTGRKRRR